MSALRTLVAAGPALCGAKNPERWAFPYLAAFDADALKKTDIFDLKPGESIEDRLEILKGLYVASGVDSGKVDHWIGLLNLCAHSCAVHKGLHGHAKKRDALAQVLSVSESDNPEFAKVMTVADASVQSTWF